MSDREAWRTGRQAARSHQMKNKKAWIIGLLLLWLLLRRKPAAAAPIEDVSSTITFDDIVTGG